MKHFRDWSFSAKQNTAVIALMVLIFGSVFFWTRQESRRIIGGQIDMTARTQVELTAAKINADFPVVAAAARELAAALELMPRDEQLQRQLLSASFRRLRREVPALCGISIAYKPYGFAAGEEYYMLYVQPAASGDGVELSRIGGPEYRYDRFDWFVIPKLLGRGIWTEPYFDSFAERKMTTWAQPLHSADGAFLGITGFDLSLEGLKATVASADAYGYGREFLLSRFGRFVVFPDATGVDSRLAFNATIFSLADMLKGSIFAGNGGAAQLRRIGRDMLAGKTGSAPLTRLSELSGEPERFYYAPVSTPGWSIGVIYPEKQLMAKLYQLEWQLGAIALIGMLLMFLAVAAMNRRLGRPLRQLERAARSIGGGDFNTVLPPPGGDDEIGRLNRAFGTMQHELDDYVVRLRETAVARQKIESELEVARRIQLGILPKMPLTEERKFSLFAMLRPARAVGGDLYDFFPIDEHHDCFIIGDVSGKGVPASLFMAVTQTLQRSEAGTCRDPAALVGRINALLAASNDSMMFVTYFLGILDLRDGSVEYTNAGHNPPCVMRRGGTLEFLDGCHGPALGVDGQFRYRSDRVALACGDTLVLYTDGVTEALDCETRQFGLDALRQTLTEHSGVGPDALGAAIVSAVDRFAAGAEQADDITLLVLRWNHV